MASELSLFFDYMQAFELAFLTDDWTAVASHFDAEAVHEVDGGAAPLGIGGRGRDAVIADLRAGVDAVDRRFDLRLPEILDGPRTRTDGVWMRFALRLRRQGLPELYLEGEHVTVFRDGRIVALRERLEPGSAARVAAFLHEHDAALRPAASSFVPPSADGMRELEDVTGRALVRCYAGAKSERDVEAALTVTTPSFRIETLAFGLASRDRDDTRMQLGAFFQAFPDYQVSLEGMATAPGTVSCWGRASLSFRGDLLGITATGRSADLPIFCVFELDGAAIARERFFFDLAALADGIGVPVALLSSACSSLRDAGLAA